MWTNVATPGWSSMMIKPQASHTAVRCRGTWLRTSYYFIPALVWFLVTSWALIDVFINIEAVQAGVPRLSDEFLVTQDRWLFPAAAIYVFAFSGRFWLGNPEVRVDSAGVTIQNLWRTTRIGWREVERIDLAGYAGITIKTAHQEILCAGLRCSAFEWLPLGRESRRRARWELGMIRDWLDQCRATAVSGAIPTHDRP